MSVAMLNFMFCLHSITRSIGIGHPQVDECCIWVIVRSPDCKIMPPRYRQFAGGILMGRTSIQCSAEFVIRAQYLHSWPITALDSPWRGRPRSWRRRRVCCPRVRSVYTWRTCPAAWRGHTRAPPGRSPTAAQPEHRSQNHNIARQDFNATWTKLISPYCNTMLVSLFLLCTTVQFVLQVL